MSGHPTAGGYAGPGAGAALGRGSPQALSPETDAASRTGWRLEDRGRIFKRRYQRVRVKKHVRGRRGLKAAGLRGPERLRKNMEEVTRSKRGPKLASVSA